MWSLDVVDKQSQSTPITRSKGKPEELREKNGLMKNIDSHIQVGIEKSGTVRKWGAIGRELDTGWRPCSGTRPD